MKHFLRAVVLTVLFVLPRAARADEQAKPQWYGWQTALTDFASLAVYGASSGHSDAGIQIAAGGYLLGAPIVHLAHGNPDKAFGSLLLRVATPAALGFLGYEAFGGSNSDSWGPAIGLVLGAGAGVALASLIDASVLAWDKPRPRASARVAPVVSAGPHGGMVGIGGVL